MVFVPGDTFIFIFFHNYISNAVEHLSEQLYLLMPI